MRRPWFLRPPVPGARPRREEIGADEAARAWNRAYAETRRHWAGGVPTRTDLESLTRAVARDLRVTTETLKAALEGPRSTPL